MYRNSLRLICILPISVPISNPVNHSFVRRSFSIYRNTNMDIKPGVTRIGWIGTGVMGKSMVGHLMNAGYTATVYNRTKSKTEELVSKGAKVVDTPAEVGLHSDIVFTMVGYPTDVREVILGKEGVLSTLKPGSIIIDMTTSEPSLAVEIAQSASTKNIFTLDAPVSGGDIGAREARLSIMVGGDDKIYNAVMPLFTIMGKNIRLLGGAGSGQHTKMVNQILIASNMIGVCEGLLYAYKAGLNPDDVIAAVGAGAAGSWSINNLGPRIVKGDFAPGFYVEHFLKDLGIALSEAKRMKLSLPGLSLAHSLYLAVEAQGGAKRGTQALFLALQTLSNMKAVPEPMIPSSN